MTDPKSLAVWDKIRRAVELVDEGVAERIDGDGWKVYRAGTIIRIDLAWSST